MNVLISNIVIVTFLFILVLLIIFSKHFRRLIILFWQFALRVSGGGYDRVKSSVKFFCIKFRLDKLFTADRVTYFRFGVVITFIAYILHSLWRGYPWTQYLKYIVALDIAAYGSDAIDGALAEIHRTVSDRGSWLDNTADKLLCGTNLYFLASLHETWSLIIWIAFFETSLIMLRFYTRFRGLNLQANKLGKAKLLFQGLGFCFIVSMIPQLAGPGKIILIISVFFAGGSLVTHFAQNYKLILGIQRGS